MSLVSVSKRESFTDEYIYELGFDLSSVIVDYYHPSNPPMIRLEGGNKEKVLNDLLMLNKFIEEADELGIVLPFLEVDQIPFVPKTVNEYTSTCTYLILDLYTATGRKAKNAIRINWGETLNGWHGTLFYGFSGDPDDGKVVKAKMCHWDNSEYRAEYSVFHALEIKMANGSLVLDKIRDGKHSVVFKRNS